MIGAMNGLAVVTMKLLGTLAAVGSLAELVAFIGWRTSWRRRITAVPNGSRERANAS